MVRGCNCNLCTRGTSLPLPNLPQLSSPPQDLSALIDRLAQAFNLPRYTSPSVLRWKFLQLNELTGQLHSTRGDTVWTIGAWQHWKEPLVICRSGFHASEYILDAHISIAGPVLALVECAGNRVSELVDRRTTKEAFEYMRVRVAWEWTPEASRHAIWCVGKELQEEGTRVLQRVSYPTATAVPAWTLNNVALKAVSDRSDFVIAVQRRIEDRLPALRVLGGIAYGGKRTYYFPYPTILSEHRNAHAQDPRPELPR